MTTPVSRLQDETYLNWCRESLALLILKEGLEEFTNRRVSDFHDELHRTIPQPYSRNGPLDTQLPEQQASACVHICKSCTHDEVQRDRNRWRVRCPSKVCNTWIKHILRYHLDGLNPNIEHLNLKPQLWPSHPWEVAKCFLPYGCGNITTARDADVAAILKLMRSCVFMSNYSTNSLLFEEVLNIRHRLMHSSNMIVSDDQLRQDTGKMIELLNSLKDLSSTEFETVHRTIGNIHKSIVAEVDVSREVNALRSKMHVIDKELANLRAQCCDHDKLLQDQSKTLGDLLLQEKHERTKTDIHQLEAERERFEEFLQKNDLVSAFANLSTRLHYQEKRFDQQEERMQTLEEQIKSKAVAVGAERVKSWKEQCKEVQQHLLDLYGNTCLWENPMTTDQEPIPQMYVQPDVKQLKEKDEHGDLTELKNQYSKVTYENIFSSSIGLCKNVYITGDAGTGKTTFCNQLVLSWCKAVQNIQDESVSYDDQTLLKSFKFLFYINLRDVETIYHVEDMIKKHLFFKVLSYIDVSDLLKCEKCLLVLDGLDEWSCPDSVVKCPGLNKDIPGRTINQACFFLTTTRNWKFDVINLKTKDIDKHIELCGINEDSSKELAQKMIDCLDRKSPCGKTVDDFYTEIYQKRLYSLVTMPVLLIQMISLWHYGKDLGNSQIQLYCSMIDLLFERSEKNITQNYSDVRSKQLTTYKQLPDCFSTKDFCQNHANLLHCLAKLAYKSLFNKQKEDALVFKSSRLQIFGISPSDLDLCLQCGILSQNKVYSNYTGKYKKMSFLHKKLQEFFTALYIVSFDTVETVLKDLKIFCDSYDIMLEMSQVWIFVAGMRPDMAKQLLIHLTHLVNNDKQVKSFRQILNGEGLIGNILTCVTDCVAEGGKNAITYDAICLEDLYISGKTACHVVDMLMCIPKTKVRSVYMYSLGIGSDELNSITSQLQQCCEVQKLHLFDMMSQIPVTTVAELVHNNRNTLTCLRLWWITATEKLVTAICNSSSKSLMAIGLYENKLTHNSQIQILKGFSQSSTLRILRLKLICTDHDDQCRPTIDLSKLTQLQELVLFNICVDNLQALSYSVIKVELWDVTSSVDHLCEFVTGISKTRHEVEVYLFRLTVTESVDSHTDLKAFLYGFQDLRLTQCCFDDKSKTWSIELHTTSQ